MTLHKCAAVCRFNCEYEQDELEDAPKILECPYWEVRK
ncbi:hypothetical protein LCGC14_1037190 [marine sediment metagenome]|uniref:Uncharacterized protein n=1 Tax=marine sediment metagenome TaxID=412755 RepID=A0A0F9QYY5_9ZZZZ